MSGVWGRCLCKMHPYIKIHGSCSEFDLSLCVSSRIRKLATLCKNCIHYDRRPKGETFAERNVCVCVCDDALALVAATVYCYAPLKIYQITVPSTHWENFNCRIVHDALEEAVAAAAADVDIKSENYNYFL